jgi:ABC transport system ATP-binding/permease protein
MSQASFWLTIVEGPTPGIKIDLFDHEMIIGRDPDVDIIINSPAVSRKHARILVQDRATILEDLGSSNGTFVNEIKLAGQATLKPGDRVRLGRSIMLELGAVLPPEPVGATVIENQGRDVARDVNKTVLGDVIDNARLNSHLPTQPSQLEVTIAGGKPVTYTLNRAELSIGRQDGNDIVISSPIVSRKLGTLKQTPQGYILAVSPEATNPVYFEGRPVAGELLMRHGQQLRIGGEDPGMMVTLRYMSPSQVTAASPQVVSFAGKERVTIGRDASNDITLDTPQVSRFHAQVERIGQRYRVTDLRSTNGTFVNNQRIEGTAWLQPNDTLRIGANRFIVGDVGLSRVDESGGLRVEAVGLNKWVRKDLNLLKDISLVFHPREFVVVVGQSGGGKSTLVDAVAGYRPATAGKVLVNGIDVYHNFDAIRNEIGFVPQKDIIHMELTVYQALDYAAQLRMPADTTREERHKRILQVLEDLDLSHRKDVQISGLSGGQQKRVSIGVELLTQPGLFFLDEPTSGLDPGTETALMQLMRRLSDQGRTIILITHATKNVMLADKVVFLARGGYLAWFGPPDEALTYFDQYRSERDRHARPIEFDEIYAILDDPSKGTAEEWAKRFRQHAAYTRYIVKPLAAFGHEIGANGAKTVQPEAKPLVNPRKATRNPVSGLRQFFILSARNARILTRDRPSLILMLAVAPILSLLDVILSFVLGRDLFSYQNGNVASVVTSMFMPIMYSIMVGALAQMREFVKESDIYRRERLVNLKVLPYVLSKVWVAGLLALYQAMVYTGVHYLAFKMPGGTTEFLMIYISLYLATFAGMMLGLMSSALAPNANAVPMIVILFLVPQFTLGGAMIPVPDFISGPTSARWAFEALLAAAGPGSDLAADSCWALPEKLRDSMTLEDKQAHGCICMGLNALNPNSCNFPGIGKAYDPVLAQPEPVKPQDIGNPPPDPVIPPAPQAPDKNADNVQMATYLQALKDYQAQTDKIQNDYKAQMQTYQAKADVFKQQATQYQTALSEWKIKRNSAVGEAEGIMKAFYTDFKWTFVDKHNQAAFWGKIIHTWVMQGVIILVLTIASILFIWRKDAV